MDVLAMLRSDLLQAAGIYAFLVLFAAVSLLVMRSQAAKQAGRKRVRVAGASPARGVAGVSLARGVRVAGVSLARGVRVAGVSLARGVRVAGSPLMRGLRVVGGPVVHGLRVAGRPLVRGGRVAGLSLSRGFRAAGLLLSRGFGAAGLLLSRGFQAAVRPVARGVDGLLTRTAQTRWARRIRNFSARLAPLFAVVGGKRNPEAEAAAGEAFAGRWTTMPPSVLAATAGAGPLARRARELVRYAGEVGVAAERAADMAEKARQEWLAAQEQLEEAWQAFETSEAEARRFDRAAILPLPHAPKTPAEYAFRERYLHRVAMAACSRRQLSALDLSDALAHRDGWDPKRHPAEQEVVLRRAVRDCMWAGYRAAAKRERAAWRTAEMAQEAKLSLRREAAEASALARQAASGKPLALATWSHDNVAAPVTVDAPSWSHDNVAAPVTVDAPFWSHDKPPAPVTVGAPTWTATPASVESTTLILPIADAVTSPLPTRRRSAALEAGRQAQHGAGARGPQENTLESLMTPRILESVKLAAQTKEQAEAQKGAAGRLLARNENVPLVGYRDSARRDAEPLVGKENSAPEGERSQELSAPAGRRGRAQQGGSRQGRAQQGRPQAGRRGGGQAAKGGARISKGGIEIPKGGIEIPKGGIEIPKGGTETLKGGAQGGMGGGGGVRPSTKDRLDRDAVAAGRDGAAGGATGGTAADAMTTATLVLPVIVAEKPYAATRSRRRG